MDLNRSPIPSLTAYDKLQRPVVNLKSKWPLANLLLVLKICNFSVNGDEEEKVGLVLSDNTEPKAELVVYDATLMYASLLANKGKKRPYELADAILPDKIQLFLDGGQDSLDAMGEVRSFAKDNPSARGPRGEKLSYKMSEIRLLAPVPKPGMVLCGVLNTQQIFDRLRTWADNKTPSHPFYFTKARSSIIGPGDPIEVPELLVWPETELGIIINKKGKNISRSEVNDYIIGYTVFNDVTAGGLHGDDTVHYINPDGSEGLPFRFLTRYKGFDTFGPMGPWIVTKDEIKNPNNLKIRCWIKDVLAQEGSTSELSTTCESLIEYITTYHTLSPGDVIVSGTCPPAKGRLLRDNDLRKLGGECTCEIEGVGRLVNPIKPITTSKKYVDASQML